MILLRRRAEGRSYLLVCQRGVLSEQLREVRDPSGGGRVDPLLLHRIQLLERGRVEVGLSREHTHTHTEGTHHTVHILLWAL